MKHLFIYLLLGGLFFPLPLRADFGFDELELIQSSEQGELLEKAREAAGSNSFDQAEKYLNQARQKGYAPEEVKEAENFLASSKAAFAAEQARIAREEEEKRLAEERRRKQDEAARQARLAQQRYDASGDKGGRLNCNYIFSDFGLWQYCTKGICDGLSGDYPLWRLCEYDDVGAMSANYEVWKYLKDGVVSFSDVEAYRGAKQNSGSFADRKRFVIYYLRGYVFYTF